MLSATTAPESIVQLPLWSNVLRLRIMLHNYNSAGKSRL